MGLYRPTYTDATGQRRQSHVYWIRLTIAGRKHRESTGERDRDKAQAIHDRRERELRAQPEDVGVGKTFTLTALGRLLLEDYQANGHRQAKRARLSFDHLKRHLGSRTPAANITARTLKAYVRSRLGEGAARATINRELSAIGRAFTLAMRDGIITTRPHIQKLRENNARKGFVEREEFGRLLPCLPPHLRPLLRVAYITGWRTKSELLPMTWSQVDFDGGWLRLEPNTTKNGEGREFPLIAELSDVFESLRHGATLSPNELVFTRNRRPIVDFKKSWASATQRAGLAGLYVHDLRRSAARNLLRAGIPAVTVLKLCGWKSMTMLQRYAITETSMLVDAGERLSAYLAREPNPSDRERRRAFTRRHSRENKARGVLESVADGRELQ